MKRILALTLLCSVFTFGASALAADFIEGQMKFRLLPDGTKDFTYQWDEEDQIIRVRLGLVWDNYEEALHGRGFDLRQVERSFPIFPDSFDGCVYYKGYGSIPGAADRENNEVFLEFKGPNCREMPAHFFYGTIAAHFYNVKSWDSLQERTEVFRLQIWDFPSPAGN